MRCFSHITATNIHQFKSPFHWRKAFLRSGLSAPERVSYSLVAAVPAVVRKSADSSALANWTLNRNIDTSEPQTRACLNRKIVEATVPVQSAALVPVHASS